MEDEPQVEPKYEPKYMVCPDCQGEGHHVLHGHAFTRDELDELGPEFWDDMMDGMYDTTCETCHGQRVVLTADLDRIHDEWADARMRMYESGIYDWN